MNSEVDKSGQPRSEEDLREALSAVENVMLKNILKVPPELAVLLGVIRDALREAIVFRKLSERKQVGWYDPGDKRFCYMDVKEHSQLNSFSSYTEPVWVFDKEGP